MSRVGLIFGVLTFGLAGCATLSDSATDSKARVIESSSDVVNRAPAQMSIPPTDQIDETQIRSKADYHFTMGEALALEGQSREAVEEFKHALVFDPKGVQIRVRLATEYIKLGLVSEAMAQMQAAVALQPEATEARFQLGALFLSLRMMGPAAEQYQAVLAKDPEHAEANLYLGAIHAERKDFDKALAQFIKVGEMPTNPASHLAWYYAGRVMLEESSVKNEEEAVKALRRALSVRSNYLEAVLTLAQHFEEKKKTQEAIQVYRAHQERHGANGLIADSLARLYLERGEWSNALQQLRIVEGFEPDDISVKMRMAYILTENKSYPEAIQKLNEVIRIEPESDRARFYLGALQEELKDYASALEHFAKIPVGSSYYGEAITHTAVLNNMLGNRAQSIAALREGISNKPDHEGLYPLLGHFLQEQRDSKGAKEAFEAGLARFPKSIPLLHGLADWRYHHGNDVPGAIALMKSILEIDRENKLALNFLAYTWAELGENLEAAEEMARRALRAAPQDGYILDTLGWVLFRAGRVAEAIPLLESALRSEPDEAVIAEHLGDAYYQSRMPEKARQMYLKAAENGRRSERMDQDDLAKIEQKLAATERQLRIEPGSPMSAEATERRPASNP